MKNFYNFCILSIILFIFANTASATSFTFKLDDPQTNGISSLETQFNGESRTSWVGEFNLMLDSESFIGYCIDYNTGIDYETYTVTLEQITENSNNPENIIYAAWLMDEYALDNTSNNEKAALQLAIWATLYNFNSTSYSFNSNPSYTFAGITDTNHGTIGSFFDQYTNALETNASSKNDAFSDLTHIYKIIDIPNKQNILIRTDPIPEPATILLFGLGLLGISAVGRKRS